MDKETKVAYEIIRQRIVERLDTLGQAQVDRVKLPSGDINSLKKWRRFGAAFAWDPEVFQDVLAKPDMPDSQLISALRKAEDTLMRKWGVINKIPLHHIVANRTGGDLGIRTPVDTWLETRKRVFDATGAKPGDGISNLNAASQFDELAHQGRPGAKGTPFADTGIKQRSDFPVLHRAGQNLAEKAGKDTSLILGTAKEQANVLIPSVKQQQARFAETTATPEVQAQRQVLTRAGYPEAFAPDTPIERIQQIASEIKDTDIPKKFALAFDFSKGSATLNKLVKTPAGRMVLAGTGLTAVGALSDISAVQASASTPRTDDIGQLERDFSGLSGIAGLATLTPAAPVAVPAALAFSGAGVVTEYRRKRDEELEKTRQYMDPANRRYIGDSVITKTKPKLPVSFTGRL